LLPNGSKLIFKKTKGSGISLAKIKDKKLMISNRKGGENFKPDLKRPTKKIKQLLQESDLPPWDRESLPIIFIAKDVVYLPNFGVDVKYQPKPKEAGLEVTLCR
jgi:tRNA(Ile)-lysidine synthase